MKEKLGNYVFIKTGRLDANAANPDGDYPFFTCAVEPLAIATFSYDCECVLVAGNGDLNVKYYNGKFDAYQRTYIIESRDKSVLAVPYLYYFLMKYVEELRSQAIGGVIKYIKLGNLTDAPLPIPSLVEQEKIVKKLQTLTNLISKKKLQLQKLDQLARSRFSEMFEDNKSSTVSFGKMCDFLRNGASIKQIKGAGGYPITRIETLANGVFNKDRLGYADITDLQRFEQYALAFGDILISHINSVAYLGRAVQYKGELSTPIIHGMNLLCARLKQGYHPTYIEYFFKTANAKQYIASITKKAVNQASITVSDLKEMRVQSPPIELQNEFAAFVEQLDKSKVTIRKSIEKLETTYRALLQEYFEIS